jgi:hypothetical protein
LPPPVLDRTLSLPNLHAWNSRFPGRNHLRPKTEQFQEVGERAQTHALRPSWRKPLMELKQLWLMSR